MAIGDIVTNNSILQASIQGRDVFLRNAQLINEALRNLTATDTESSNSLLINQTPPSIEASDFFDNLTPLQQNALFVNQTLQGISTTSSETTDALLIDETPAVLEAQEAFDGLNLVQENDLLVNTIFQNLNSSEEDLGTQINPSDLQDANNESVANTNAIGNQNSSAILTENQQIVPTGQARITESLSPVAQIGQQDTISPALVPVPQATQTLAETPTVETVREQIVFDPASLPFLLNPDRTPYGMVAYETKDLNQVEQDPAPPSKEVQPVLPTENSRSIDHLVQSLIGLGYNKKGQQRTNEVTPTKPLKSIKYMVHEANDDLAQRGSSLHLVLVKKEQGYALDVYNCSYSEICALEHDVLIELTRLPSILNNLDQESGLIINKLL